MIGGWPPRCGPSWCRGACARAWSVTIGEVGCTELDVSRETARRRCPVPPWLAVVVPASFHCRRSRHGPPSPARPSVMGGVALSRPVHCVLLVPPCWRRRSHALCPAPLPMMLDWLIARPSPWRGEWGGGRAGSRRRCRSGADELVSVASVEGHAKLCWPADSVAGDGA